MGLVIHTRNVNSLKFRMWCTSSDSYVTEEMNEIELRYYLMIERLENMVKEDNARVQRAKDKGTSMMGDNRDLSGPWGPQMIEDEDES